MAETAIEWTERTWNPIVGCSIVSPGCTNCYAMKMARRLDLMGVAHYAGLTQQTKAGAVWTGKLALAPEHVLLEPLRRRKPTTYFVNSMGDLFHEAVPDAWVDRVFAVMALAPHHTFQVLTKRAARMREFVTSLHAARALAPIAWHLVKDIELAPRDMTLARTLPNVWLGVSAEDQKRADERIPELLATPAAVHFASNEPALGPVDYTRLQLSYGRWLNALTGELWTPGHAGENSFTIRGPKLDWIIVGGESGPGARPMHPDWPRQIRDQCAAAGTAFFFKQWGNWFPLVDRDKDDPDWRLDYSRRYSDDLPGIAWLNIAGGRGFHGDRFHIMGRGMKATAGRFLDGVEHNAMPEVRRG